MSGTNIHNMVGKLKPRRNAFDLSYRTNLTCKMGQLIPVMCDEVVPGDHFKIGNELVIRLQPMAAPVMHEVYAHVHYFFVPYRLLWDGWEDFITTGLTAEGQPPIPLPRIEPSQVAYYSQRGTIWDYLGLPVVAYNHEEIVTGSESPVTTPVIFPWRAYNFIWSEYYRDENLQVKMEGQALDQPFIHNRAWRKDYFTSALPFQQKGLAPALPVNVYTQWQNITNLQRANQEVNLFLPDFTKVNGVLDASGLTSPGVMYPGFHNGVGGAQSDVPLNSRVGIDVNLLGSKMVYGLSTPTATFGVSELRLAMQTQKWLERNARAGTRYTSFLQAHFSVSPTDARLDRPEYIGGSKMPVMITEVVQTSETNTATENPLGQFAGHGLGADSQFCGTYNVQEYGLIMGIMSIMPKPAYQDGINRQWLRETPLDFYFPEFAHLSEQAIKKAEIYWGNGYYDDQQTFGYTGQYDEMRIKHDIVCADMRKYQPGVNNGGLATANLALSYWNMARRFTAPPNLNAQFIICNPDPDIFTVEEIAHCIVNCYNKIKAVRPMPVIAEPGLIDHF